VIAGTDAIPGYQRDDWRGAAQALPNTGGARIIVGEATALLPLSIYLGPLHSVSARSVSTRELDFIDLRTRRTDGAPLRPVAPTQPPSGFRLAEVVRAEAYAVSRFLAPKPTVVTVKVLRKLLGKPSAEAILQR
jgi:hypothetical protein